MLIIDKYKLYISSKFIDFYIKNQIMTFCLSFYTNHIF